jgi:hypothetical protein
MKPLDVLLSNLKHGSKDLATCIPEIIKDNLSKLQYMWCGGIPDLEE